MYMLKGSDGSMHSLFGWTNTIDTDINTDSTSLLNKRFPIKHLQVPWLYHQNFEEISNDKMIISPLVIPNKTIISAKCPKRPRGATISETIF